jgi:hypothetical protein
MYYKKEKNNKKIDKISLSLLLYIIPINIYFYNGDFIFSILGICCTFSSYLYHITYEQSFLYLYMDMFFATFTLNYLIFNIITVFNFYTQIYFFILLFLSLVCYLKGTGRKETLYRSNEYEKYHLYWHILLFILSLSHSLLK